MKGHRPVESRQLEIKHLVARKTSLLSRSSIAQVHG